MDISNIILLATEQASEAVSHSESGGVVGTLGLNWKLFLAQAINFGIILLIVWKWILGPVGGALEARRKKIEESIAKAEKIEKDMQESDALREKKIKEAFAMAEEIVKKTTVQAEAAKQETISAAHSEAEKILAKATQMIEAEKNQMLHEVRAEVADLVVLATEKILQEKLDENKDKELVKKIIHEIQP